MKVTVEENVLNTKPFALHQDELNKLEAAKLASRNTATNLTASRGTFLPNALKLGFVDLKGGSTPKENIRYEIVSAGNALLESIAVPQTQYKRLDLDLFAFYIDDFPDFTKKNEGLLKISANTKNPQDLSSTEAEATWATNFIGKDGSYASSFLYAGVFRNVLFENWVNLQFDLFELDTDADEYFAKVKQVIVGVPEVKNLDILKGIPYLNLAGALFDSIISIFGKNPHDHVWSEIPLMSIKPISGGAFLRSGIYILFEERNSKKEEVSYGNLEFIDNRIVIKDQSKKVLPNHLLFGVQLNPYQQLAV